MPEGTKRIVLSTSPETYSKLATLSDGPRFSGNRSKAMTWAVEIANAVLTDPTVKDTLFESPSAVLAAFVKGQKGR